MCPAPAASVPDGDAMAVTDQQCRVRGVDGLWVADSSIMPQVTRANTNATAIMIGERVADWGGRELAGGETFDVGVSNSDTRR